jgi:hypothetical protein
MKPEEKADWSDREMCAALVDETKRFICFAFWAKEAEEVMDKVLKDKEARVNETEN